MFTPQDNIQWTRLFESLQDLRSLHPQQGERLAVEGCEFLEAAPKIDRLLTWGILNPFGPTIESLCVAIDPTETREVLFVKMSNPFQSWNRAYAALSRNAASSD